jgi:hypothetical protein
MILTRKSGILAIACGMLPMIVSTRFRKTASRALARNLALMLFALHHREIVFILEIKVSIYCAILP